MIRNVVFDMGRVLVDFCAERFAASRAVEPHEQKLLLNELFHSVEWVQLDRGSITEEQALAQVCSRLPEKLHSHARHLMDNWYLDLPPIAGMEELCASLKKNGYGLYLLSNAGTRFYAYRENIPALRYFDGEFVSAEWQLLKPDEAIYRAFCGHFSLVPSQCFFVDDMPVNIESAMRTGMGGVVFRGDIAALRDAMISAGIAV